MTAALSAYPNLSLFLDWISLKVNLNSVKGQLLISNGETSGALVTTQYPFKRGNGDFGSSRYGFAWPCSVKLKKFVYQGDQNGNAYTSSTILLFQAYIDGVAQSVYMRMDFSNTTNGSTANKRFSQKFSSTSGFQTDFEPTITKTFGSQISFQCISLNGYNTNSVGHRLDIVVETQEDLS